MKTLYVFEREKKRLIINLIVELCSELALYKPIQKARNGSIEHEHKLVHEHKACWTVYLNYRPKNFL